MDFEARAATLIFVKPAIGPFAQILVIAGLAATLNASVSLDILSPQPNAIIADTLLLNVSVSSLYEVSNVVARLGPLVTHLNYGANSWANAFDTANFARASYTLTVTAQDVFGNTGQTQRMVRVDRPPVLSVAAPINGSVARSNLYVSVAASDDDPAGVRIDVYNGSILPFTGTNTVERFFPGFAGTLRIEVTDSSHQKTVAQRTVYIEPSTNLLETISAPGPLLDFSGSRLLYASIPDPPEPPAGRLSDISSGLTITAPAFWSGYPVPGQYYKPTLGWVSAESAVLAYETPSVYGAFILALQRTNFSVIAQHETPPEQVVDGVCVIGQALFDFSESTNGCLPYLGRYSAFNFYRDLAKGEIVFSDTNGVFRSRPTKPLNVCPRVISLISPKAQAYNPVTDGTNVVFHWSTNIIANIDGQDEVLATWLSSQNMQYLANGGWIAFTKPGTMNQQQIWTRSPTGQFEQRTFFSISSYLESLSSDGSVTFQIYNQGGPSVGRYLSLSGAQPVWINSGQGKIKWEAGAPFVLIGRSAFRVSLGKLRVYAANAETIGLELRSPNGLRYSIQESSDLSNWSSRVTLTNTTGIFFLTNSITNLSSKFYRAVLRP